jgi:hypothetical protein
LRRLRVLILLYTLWLLQLFIFKLALIESIIVFISTDLLPNLGKDLLAKLVESLFEVNRLLVDFRINGIVEFAIIPTELNLIENLLHKLILSLVVLSSDEV